MTSCIAASLLSRSAVPRWGGGGWRGWRGSFPLSVCTFFFSIRWIQSRAHGLGSVFGPRDVLLLLPFLSFSQLEWTRAVHVTSHLERGAGPGFNRSLNFRLNYLWGHTYPSCHTSRGAAGCVVFPDRYNHNYFCKKNKNQTRSRKYVN